MFARHFDLHFRPLIPPDPLRPAYRPRQLRVAQSEPDTTGWIEYPGGIRQVGHAGDSFAWDNEFPRHEVLIHPFRLADRLVTNAEWLDFIADGGYETASLWLSDGWAWRESESVEAPLYWQRDGEAWTTLTLGGVREVRAEEPVTHLSFYEAAAFAEWSGARLPTEFEWEVAAHGIPLEGNFASSGRLHPAPAPAGPGLVQLFGDVWEWTRSDYAPYPGFAPAAGALGEYNGKFMCNQRVLRGGSCATPAGHLRPSYRNFFPPSARWQFAGLRLARDV